ncbi:MAG: rod shape-determining protein MreC [Dermatophilaceae bacterium]
MDTDPRRRLLLALVAITVVLLVADLAGTPVARQVRSLSASALGPVQRVLSGVPADDLAALEAENAQLRVTTATQARELRGLQDLRDLLGSDPARAHTLVGARVVASELSALGGRRVTLDVGSRDGIVVDSTVAAAQGLVGRVVAVGPWTSDVQVLGGAGATVGVRVGAAGLLGTVGASTVGGQAVRPRGTLTLTLIGPGTPRVGDTVTTLGSVNEMPYAAGIPVGVVTALDPDRGQVTSTATVRPGIDPDALEVVAVLVPTPRGSPRPGAPGVRP